MMSVRLMRETRNTEISIIEKKFGKKYSIVLSKDAKKI